MESADVSDKDSEDLRRDERGERERKSRRVERWRSEKNETRLT